MAGDDYLCKWCGRVTPTAHAIVPDGVRRASGWPTCSRYCAEKMWSVIETADVDGDSAMGRLAELLGDGSRAVGWNRIADLRQEQADVKDL